MSRGVNLCILVGHVGKDPEVKNLSTDRKVANFTLATSESWKDRQSGEKKEHTEWHRCQAWGSLAGIVEKYVHKGSQLYVEGKIKTRKWTDRDGKERYTTEVEVSQIQLLGGKSDGARPAQSAAEAPPQRAPAGGGGGSVGERSLDDDDIPFITRDSIW